VPARSWDRNSPATGLELEIQGAEGERKQRVSVNKRKKRLIFLVPHSLSSCGFRRSLYVASILCGTRVLAGGPYKVHLACVMSESVGSPAAGATAITAFRLTPPIGRPSTYANSRPSVVHEPLSQGPRPKAQGPHGGARKKRPALSPA
jgi:hypothetical protein